MPKRIYVGNLSYDVNDDSLRDMFAEHGTVDSARVVTDRFSGQSRGFGFVEMANDAEADAAISTLSGQDHKGRTLTVNEAMPREERSRGGGGRGPGMGGGGRGRGGGGGGGGGGRGGPGRGGGGGGGGRRY
jgi:RNA recognition motif-containing protein